MKAKNLIKILMSVDPESDVWLSVGTWFEDKEANRCAKMQLMRGDCLDLLQVEEAKIFKDEMDESDEKYNVQLILEQKNWPEKDMIEAVQEFDRLYPDFKD